MLHEPTATALTGALRRLFLRTAKYESPADRVQKEEFTPLRVKALLAKAGFTDISTSLPDVMAVTPYPVAENYLGSPLSRSQSVMEFMCRLERLLGSFSSLSPICELFAWRLLVVSLRPKVPAIS